MNVRDVVRYELIGLNTKVVDAKNKDLVGIKGKIVDETKNMLVIEEKGKMKKVIKSQAVLDLNVKDKVIRVDGRLLVGRPEERIKKVRKI